MSDRNPVPPPSEPGEDPIRPHVFDGIAEFNRRLPNWWLFTLYASIAFCIVYWVYYAQSGIPESDGARIERELTRIEAAKMAAAATLDDETLWKMSRNPVFVQAGKAVFDSTCASCHAATLTGGIGSNLVDQEWVHGGDPLAIHHTITEGVMAKGMPAWGGVLGNKKVMEAVAYILSHHEAPDGSF